MGLVEMLDGQDMGGMFFSSQGDCGFYEEDEEDGDVDDFWKIVVVWWFFGL